MLTLALREAFRREALPKAVLHLLAADGLSNYYRMFRAGLAPHVGGPREAEALLASTTARAFQRRYELLRREHASLPSVADEPRAVGLVMGALSLSALRPRSAFMFAGVGGAPASPLDHARALRWIAPLSATQRWEELTTHLGETLIALTEELPKTLKGANAILGRVCFEGGAKYATNLKCALRLPDHPDSAIEVLRMGEYVFRVNPEHWHASDGATMSGYLEGTACPWWSAPGWGGMHCGIFGQYQSGIASVFGMKYHLTQTIPKHGGHTCRIDLRPLVQLRTTARTN